MDHSRIKALAAKGLGTAFMVASVTGAAIGVPAVQASTPPVAPSHTTEHDLELVVQLGSATIAADGDDVRVESEGRSNHHSFGLVRDMLRVGSTVAVLTSLGVSITTDGHQWQRLDNPVLSGGTGLTTHRGGYLAAIMPNGMVVHTGVR